MMMVKKIKYRTGKTKNLIHLFLNQVLFFSGCCTTTPFFLSPCLCGMVVCGLYTLFRES